MGETRNAYKRLSENMMERDHFKDWGTDERIIWEWILVKQDGKEWLDTSGSG
jgi:hypothetical protein